MYTRGNGIEGQDISHCIKDIGINTERMLEGDAIRGELIISKANFKKIEDIMSNARNAVAGIINTKKPDPSLLKLVEFVAYWVVHPEFKIADQLKYIEKKEFVPRSVIYEVKKKLTIDILSEMLISGRKDYKYEMDGVVVIDSSKIYLQEEGSNPAYGFAFKQILTDQIAEATVVDVIWEISKDKYIKPKIKINTIELLGSEITYATAFNAKYIVDNVIGPGAIVKIIKSGDVIPKIEEIIKVADTKKPKMPSIKYEWNETNVDIIAIELDEENMNKVITKKLGYFFSTFGVEFMAEGTIQKFVENGYDDLWKILKADKEKLYKIDGLGKKSIDKIYESINKSLTNRKLHEIMAASQIFGRGIGTRKIKLITDNYPNILELQKSKSNEELTKLINSISGFEEKTTSKIVDNFDDFIVFMNKLIKIKPNLIKDNTEDKKDKKNKSNKSSEDNKDNKDTNNLDKYKDYKNKTIVFTGFRDKEIESILENVGAKITTSVSKNTDIVVAADVNDDSSKVLKAKELKIKLLSKEQFYKNINS
jgi:NAD-dependent DNA ligase